MTDILPCKRCKTEPYRCCGDGISKDVAYTFGKVECPKCGNIVKVLSTPDRNSFDVLEDAIMQWNSQNEVPFKKKKACKTCKSYVEVGYKCKKKCLKNGKCDE